MTDIIIGIDLGTTNSEVAVLENGRPRVIESDNGKILPSVVGVADDDTILIGESAKNQYLLYPERTVKSVKRLMGKQQEVDMAGIAYSPQEISAMLLKRLKQIAEQDLQQTVEKAVITVPAYFSDAQRKATREAGELAGLEVVRMINEPTAAALAYEADLQQQKKMLVYDLGGGTFDVSVVNMEADVVEVLASHGNNQLGGDDFDNKILQHFLDQLTVNHDIAIDDDKKVMARLTRAAESAKIALSEAPFVQVDEEYLLEHDGQAIHLSLELARTEYEAMIEDYIHETLDAVHIALKDADLTASDIDDIILVGGATRTPCIRSRLYDLFGMEAHDEVDPDLCVALGAATQAGMIAGQQVSSVLVDVTPYTYGTSAIGMLDGEMYPFAYVPVIRKNTTLPTSKTEAFETSRDGQDKVDVTVYQGEDPDALKNIEIGQFWIEGLKDVPAGNVIIMTLSLDLDGIMHVTAKEKATGLEKSITIQNALSGGETDDRQNSIQRIEKFFGQNDQLLADNFNRQQTIESEPDLSLTQQWINRAEALFETVSAEDKEDMQTLINTIRQAEQSMDDAALDTNIEQLQDIIYYLES